MKKYLMSGIAAFAIAAAFTSCSKSTDLYEEGRKEKDQAAQKGEEKKVTYEEAFTKRYGKIDSNNDWGFGSIGKRCWIVDLSHEEANSYGTSNDDGETNESGSVGGVDFLYFMGLLVHVFRPCEEAHKLHDEVVDGHAHVGIKPGNQRDVNHQAAVDKSKDIVGEFAFAAQHHIDDAASGSHDVDPIKRVTGLVVFEQNGQNRDNGANGH